MKSARNVILHNNRKENRIIDHFSLLPRIEEVEEHFLK